MLHSILRTTSITRIRWVIAKESYVTQGEHVQHRDNDEVNHQAMNDLQEMTHILYYYLFRIECFPSLCARGYRNIAGWDHEVRIFLLGGWDVRYSFQVENN